MEPEPVAVSAVAVPVAPRRYQNIYSLENNKHRIISRHITVIFFWSYPLACLSNLSHLPTIIPNFKLFEERY